MQHETRTTTTTELRGVLLRWVVVLAAVGVFAVWASWRMSAVASRLPATVGAATAEGAAAEPEVEYWTCTMHPEVRQDTPGKCPICGMTLVPKYVGSDEPGVKPAATPMAMGAGETAQAWYRCTMPECGDQGSADPNSHCPVCGMQRKRVDTGSAGSSKYEITLSERAQHLAEVEAEPAREHTLFKQIRTIGRVGYDETRYKMVSAWIGGRIDKLFADFTGMTVSAGDHLVEMYSPELLSAQEEYLQALRATRGSDESQTSIARRSGEQVLVAARRKLELLGITDAQIDAIEQSGQPQVHSVVYAPIGGTIVRKQAMEGMYVKTGDVLYAIADLTHMWLLVDVYEADLPWVQPFQEVRVTTRSLPGEVFTGQNVFIDPKLDPQSRTVQVRIHVDNPALRLKPEMWVTAEIDAALARGGRGAVPRLGGDFACPMHPWETSDQPATCPICEMDMVRVEDLPQYSPPTEPAPMLSVPRSAVMQTGERALVYVVTKPGTYRGVEVTVGPLAQDESGREYYPILSGLSGGEEVVTRGNFAIDSQMQLAGKPSLFTARGLGDGDTPSKDETHSGAMSDAPTTAPSEEMQTLCPVMGSEIDPDVYIEYKGERVYFCCSGCDDEFRADPEKYVPKLPAAVQKRIHAAEQRDQLRKELGQTMCPVTGKPIDPAIWINFEGTPVYFATPAAVGAFMGDALTYIGKLPRAMQQRIAKAEMGGAVADATPSPWQQTVCPVMGNPITPKSYVDYRGVRVYFCCPGCDEKFLATPEKYVSKLPPKIAQVIREAGQKGGGDD